MELKDRKVVLYYQELRKGDKIACLTLAEQERIAKCVIREGANVIGQFTDSYFAKNRTKNLEKAIAVCKENDAILVILAFDLLSRSTHVLAELTNNENLEFLFPLESYITRDNIWEIYTLSKHEENIKLEKKTYKLLVRHS